MYENENITLFDPIINSEDEMIKCAGLQNAKFQAYTYLRAYIMATLCFTKKLVVTDTAVSLNRAFRTLIDKDEENGHYFGEEKKYLLYPADFSWLIKNDHISIVARDSFVSFSDLLKEQKEKKHVDLPSEQYVEMIDAICPNRCMKKYSIEDASIKFSTTFRGQINDKLNDINISLQMEKILKELIYRLSGEETFTYSKVKSILLDNMKIDEKGFEYKFIHEKLRQSYDYNIPNLLHLDYRMSFRNIKPSKNQDWKLDLNCKKLKRDFLCSVYGLASLPARSLRDIWESKEGIDFFQQIGQLRDETFELNEYVEWLNNYLLLINDVIRDNYRERFTHESGREKKCVVKFREYFKTDGKYFVVAKVVNDIYSGVNYVRDFDALIWDTVICKLIPCIAKKMDGFPDPPEKMVEAVIMKSRSEKDSDMKTDTVDDDFAR